MQLLDCYEGPQWTKLLVEASLTRWTLGENFNHLFLFLLIDWIIRYKDHPTSTYGEQQVGRWRMTMISMRTFLKVKMTVTVTDTFLPCDHLLSSFYIFDQLVPVVLLYLNSSQFDLLHSPRTVKWGKSLKTLQVVLAIMFKWVSRTVCNSWGLSCHLKLYLSTSRIYYYKSGLPGYYIGYSTGCENVEMR